MSDVLNRPAAPIARRPRLRITTNGLPIPGALEAEITENNARRSNTFTAKFAYSFADDPAGTTGLQWWCQQQNPMPIDIQIGSIQTDGSIFYVSALQGVVDDIDINPQAFECSISGRDNSALLIDQKTDEQFVNQTTSQIATTLAGRVGLTASVPTTSTLAGRFWQIDHSVETRSTDSKYRSYWDLLTALARDEGFDLWVYGTTLHMAAPPAPDADPFVVNWQPPTADRAFPQANVVTLDLKRSLTLAGDIVVNVHSFHSKRGASFKKTARLTAAKKSKGSKPQVYDVIRPNLDEKQAQALADSMLADLSKHERVISWSEPGSFELTAQRPIKLTGTNTDFDQAYYVDDLRRHFDVSGSFTMNVRAKNHSSASVESVDVSEPASTPIATSLAGRKVTSGGGSNYNPSTGFQESGSAPPPAIN
jgi:phage protein D